VGFAAALAATAGAAAASAAAVGAFEQAVIDKAPATQAIQRMSVLR